MNNSFSLLDQEIELLTKTELAELLKDGSTISKERIIKSNLRLVFMEIQKKFKYVNCDRDDLVSIGCIGLIKSVNAYDVCKGYEFSTYAIKCIDNEILMYLNRNKKYDDIRYLDEVIYNEDGDRNKTELCLKDKLSLNLDLSEQCEKEEIKEILYKIINTCLTEKERKIVVLCFGLNGDDYLKQIEVAHIFNVSAVDIFRSLKKALNKIKIELEKYGYGDYYYKVLNRN